MLFLTIIAGIIALSLISSIILGSIILKKKAKEEKEYRERVDEAMERLKKDTADYNIKGKT